MKITLRQLRNLIRESLGRDLVEAVELSRADRMRIVAVARQLVKDTGGVDPDSDHLASRLRSAALDAMNDQEDSRLDDSELPNDVILDILLSHGFGIHKDGGIVDMSGMSGTEGSDGQSRVSEVKSIIEQFGITGGQLPRAQMSLEDTGPFMRNAIVRSAMGEINHWKGMTNEHELDPRWQALHRDKPTFESYADSALDEIREKVFKGDYVIPLDMVGMKEMKITKRQLRRIILESLNEAKTVPSLWWEYDPQDVVTDIYHQRRQLPPKDWKNHWPDIKRKLEEKWPRPEHLAGETYESGYDYEGGEDRGLAASEYTLPPPPKPPANWRPGQRVSWNRLASHPEHGHLAVPDNYEFFLKAHDKLLADYSKDSKDPDQMASALSMIALEAQGLGPSASQPATTGFPDLDAKLRGLPPGHVDLSQLSESRIDLGRWNKMAGTLLCEADYHDFGIPVPAEELRHRSMLPSEEVQATHFSDHPGNLSLMDWANKAAHTLGLPRAESLPNFIDPMTGNAILSPVDEHRMGTSPEEYAEKVRAHERSLFDMGRM